MAGMGLAAVMQQSIDSTLQSFVTQTSAAFASALIPIALVCVTIWVIVYGFAVVRGEVQEPINLFAWKAVRVTIILSIALVGGRYQQMVIDGINGIQSFFISTLYGSSVTTITGAIDTSFNLLGTYAADFYTKGLPTLSSLGFPHFSFFIAAGLVILAQIVLVAASLIPIILATVVLKLLLGIGPVFVFFALWPATQRFTEAWLGAVLTNVFTIAVISMILSFVPLMLNGLVGQMLVNASAAAEVDPIARAMAILLICVVLGWLAWTASNVAAQLAGGASLGNPANAVAQTMMNKIAFGGGKGGGKGGGGSVDKN